MDRLNGDVIDLIIRQMVPGDIAAFGCTTKFNYTLSDPSLKIYRERFDARDIGWFAGMGDRHTCLRLFKLIFPERTDADVGLLSMVLLRQVLIPLAFSDHPEKTEIEVCKAIGKCSDVIIPFGLSKAQMVKIIVIHLQSEERGDIVLAVQRFIFAGVLCTGDLNLSFFRSGIGYTQLAGTEHFQSSIASFVLPFGDYGEEIYRSTRDGDATRVAWLMASMKNPATEFSKLFLDMSKSHAVRKGLASVLSILSDSS